MNIYDAIIIGAGPAGCAAAYDLSKAGRSVLLIDRRDFPRVKACAGVLTIKTLRALRYSVRPVIRRTARNLMVGRKLEKKKLLRGKHPIAVMTVRSEFDNFCFERTIEAGAQFKVARRIDGLHEPVYGCPGR